MPSPRLSAAGRAYRRFFPVLLITGSMLAGPCALAADSLADVVADGQPWEMYVVKRNRSNILVFRPDGRGTISDGEASINPTWEAFPGGICIKPEAPALARCLQLSRTKAGIAASQNGTVIFVLKR